MKKRAIIALLLSIVCVLSFITVNAKIITYRIGDVNNDNEIDVSDYILIKRACLNTYELSVTQQTCADIDKNEIIDTKDYVLLKRHCLNTFVIEGTFAGCDANHNYTETITPPTCTEDGYVTYTCSDCGYSYKSINNYAVGHKCDTWIVNKIPTYTEPGEHLQTCSVCGTQEIISLGCLVMTDLEIQQEIFRLVNIERQKAGVPALTYNKSAQIALDARAQDLQIKFAHERPDGSRCFAVLNDYNINSFYTLGENIAYGYLTPESVVEAWMDSPGHRANILNPDYTSIAVGEYNYSWVQMFFG